MYYDKIIQGNHIYLRNISLSDCTGKYVNWLNNTEINQYLESRLLVQTLESVTRFVLDVIESKDNYMFAIVYKKNEEHIGNIKIGPIHSIYKNTFIGYLIGEEKYWGKGLATEAVYLATKFCFDFLSLHKVNAGVIAPNIGSIRVLEKLGFKREACIRDNEFQHGKYLDTYRYGVLQTEIISPRNS